MLKLIVFACLVLGTLAFRRDMSPEERERYQANERRKHDAWINSGHTEGDMILQKGQRNGIIDTTFRWPNNEIPYEIDPVFSTSQTNQIHEAVREFANVSCVTVRPRTAADRDFVYVTGTNTGCWSWVGRLGGRQELNLQRPGCMWHEVIVHEFLHAAGFYHEQSSYNRDDHVTILWENIQRGTEHNFDKFGDDYITTFGQPYDYGSIMHYHEYAFSSNGNPTIVPHNDAWVGWLGLAEVMSDIDIVKLRLMYNC